MTTNKDTKGPAKDAPRVMAVLGHLDKMVTNSELAKRRAAEAIKKAQNSSSRQRK
jgi:hypothetical protein